MVRSNFYDGLQITVNTLNNKIEEQYQELIIIMKSDVNDEEVIKKSKELQKDIDALCKSVYNQFTALQSDYASGAINSVRYKENLKPLKDLLTDRDGKITHSDLHSSEIALELKRFF